MSEQLPVQVLPALPLKNTLLFPNLLLPLSVGRPSSLAAVQAALATEEKEIILIAQKDPSVENPVQTDLYTVGTKAVIRKMSRPNDSIIEVLVMGVERVVVLKLETGQAGYLEARVTPSPLPHDTGAEVEALQGAVIELATRAIELAQPQAPPELSRMLTGNEDP
ncbi:MAG TPA: LON peptidase substrate-binding domain-containing protein, partial [Bryobacteraceae bacterium]|nr:LON peptidase substrate-binding domain-containing protein [Bryobacteraceae bacterium]